MLRIAAIVLALAVSYDLLMLDGKYIAVAKQMSTSILHHFKVILAGDTIPRFSALVKQQPNRQQNKDLAQGPYNKSQDGLA